MTIDLNALGPVGPATEADVVNCFRLLLGRNPHQAEWPGHSLKVGQDIKDVVSTYLRSPEFASRNMLAVDMGDIVRTEYDGFSIFSRSQDYDVGHFIAQRSYEPHVQSVFVDFINPDMTVVDVGANVGFFSLLAARLVGPDGRVIAFEPNTENLKLFVSSQIESKLSNIETHGVAVDESSGLLTLSVSHSNGVSKPLGDTPTRIMGSTVIPASTLDATLNGRKVDFLKIDVEGYEFRALRGASRMFSVHRPIIESEFSPSSATYGEDYLRFLTDMGYLLTVLHHDGSRTPFGASTSNVMDAFVSANTDHIDILAVPS